MANPTIWRLTRTAALILLLSGAPAFAQKPPPAPKVPDNLKITILIKTTIIALNNANLTGNYSVLRDIAAPGFAQANNPARLAQIFNKLRQRKIDLGPTVLFQPVLSRQPVIAKNGLLILNGFFASKPENVEFEMAFQPIGGDWKLFGLRVETKPAKAAVAPAGAPARANNGQAKKSAPNQKAKKSGGKAVPSPARRPAARVAPAPPATAKKKEEDSSWWPFGEGG